jgi:hypothetical protein
MTGFGRSKSTPAGATPQSGAQREHTGRHLPLHLPHLQHFHMPRADGHPAHPLLDALTHSLDLAGRGYCCASNPLEYTAAPEGDRVHDRSTKEGGEDAKLSGK